MKHIHLVGIGGTGMSAIARVLLEKGYVVSGSDRAASQFTQDLQVAGAIIHIGHLAANVQGADLVVRSSAISDDNPEILAALDLNIPVQKRSEFLHDLTAGKTCIAVAGTHGKTTTTAMISWVLTALKQDPSFIVGGVLANLGINARAGKGPAFVIEADEYDRMFLGLSPSIEVVTNVEHDHPDCYPTPADFQEAFVQFVSRLQNKGNLVFCAEDAGAWNLSVEAKKMGKTVISYGILPIAPERELDVYARELTINMNGNYTFTASVLGKTATIELQTPGRHNVSNALAAMTVTQLLELPIEDSARALSEFTGTGRRFEVRGEVNGITVIDDYAHHPTEIRATLAAARDRYPTRRLVSVWQPHTYSRTQTLFNEFANAFSDTDELIVTEIYAAREIKKDYSSRLLVEGMTRKATFISEISEVSSYLNKHLVPGDVLLVLSAGNADQISTDVLDHFKEARHG